MIQPSQPKPHNRYTLPILAGAFVLLLAGMVAALCVPRTAAFVPPEFEPSAVVGEPTVDEGLGYTELYREGMAYRLAVCGEPTVSGDTLTVYFTNHGENAVYLKLRVLDKSGAILGETGLLRPGEYCPSVTLNQPVAADTEITLKIMGYQPETYESAGSVSLNVQCRAPTTP